MGGTATLKSGGKSSRFRRRRGVLLRRGRTEGPRSQILEERMGSSPSEGKTSDGSVVGGGGV